jgi:hypothetical protein
VVSWECSLTFLVFPRQIKEVLAQDDMVLEIAKELYDKKSLLIMGRGYNFATWSQSYETVFFFISNPADNKLERLSLATLFVSVNYSRLRPDLGAPLG